jgi:hypothetical protein
MSNTPFTLLASLGPRTDGELAAEQPLFAAEKRFAFEMGGPLTRAFLGALPPEWQADQLVVDSHLVGLPPGYDPGPTVFHREACAEYKGAAFDLANAEVDVEHAWCVFGPVMPELIAGEVDEGALPSMPAWNDRTAAARDVVLRGWLESGRLTTASPEPGAVWICDGRTWLRWGKATAPGLHLWLRATRGSRRPWVNGRRNMSMKG